jgi:hypothetical protein
MGLLPAFISARNRKNDSVSSMNAASDSRAGDSSRSDSPASDSDDDVFNLLPPESSAAPEPKPQGRNINPVDMTDLSRLSIDHDGRLYWDGKPVETHNRLSMSRRQIVGASIVAVFVVIGAIGAALQGAAAAQEWVCRLGWTIGNCTLPNVPPRNRPDIPA